MKNCQFKYIIFILLLLNCTPESVQTKKTPVIDPSIEASIPENVKSEEEIKDIALKIINESEATQRLLQNPEKEYLNDVIWGKIQLVKNLQKRGKEDTLEYYYVIYAELPDKSKAGYMCINAITGENLSGGLFKHIDSEKYFLTSAKDAVRYLKETLELSEINEYQISGSFYLNPPYSYNLGIHWKYQISLKNEIETKAGTLKDFFIDPYVVGTFEEKMTPTNTSLSKFLPHRLFVLKNRKNKSEVTMKELVGID